MGSCLLHLDEFSPVRANSILSLIITHKVKSPVENDVVYALSFLSGKLALPIVKRWRFCWLKAA